MKEKYNLIFIIVLLLTVAPSCKDKTINTFYDTGELAVKMQYINDSLMVFKQYYKNGKIWFDGYAIEKDDSSYLFVGHWKIFYADGQLWWEGDYDRGRPTIPKDTPWLNLDPETRTLNPYIQLENTRVLKGEVCNFRVIMPQVHRSFFLLVDSNLVDIPDNLDIQSAFPYTIKPERSGNFGVNLIFLEKDGYSFNLNGEHSIHTFIKVE